MRFLFTLHNFLPGPIFGAEKICVQQMAELLKRGNEIALFYPSKCPVGESQLAENGLARLKLYRTNFLDTKAQVLLSAWKPHIRQQFISAMNDFAPDVAVFHHLVRLSLDLPLAAHTRGIVTVYYLHDFYFICPSYSLMTSEGTICTGSGSVKCPRCLYLSRFRSIPRAYPFAVPLGLPFMLLRNLFIRRLGRNIDLFVSPSRFLVEQLKRNGFPCQNCVIIPYGGNGRDVAKKSSTGGIRFGYLGNTATKKGINILGKAFQDMPGVSLSIKGFPDQKAMDSFGAQFPGLQANLEPLDSNTEAFYNNIDVLIVPSLWYENQPNVIIEAFDRGKVVLCSNLGGMAEMVHERQGGLLFNPGDSDDLRQKVKYLIDNPSEVEWLASRIPKWPTMTEQVDRFLEALRPLLPLFNSKTLPQS